VMSGRPRRGSDHVEGLDGSRVSKARLRALLLTMEGELSVKEGCGRLGIGPARFAALRGQMLGAALDALEPQSPGRPRKVRDEKSGRELELEERILELERELKATQVRAELALCGPSLARREAEGKKSPRRRRSGHRPRRPPSWRA